MPRGTWFQSAAVAATFYEGNGRPVAIVFYDDEHVQISKMVRTHDERGRVVTKETKY